MLFERPFEEGDRKREFLPLIFLTERKAKRVPSLKAKILKNINKFRPSAFFAMDLISFKGGEKCREYQLRIFVQRDKRSTEISEQS